MKDLVIFVLLYGLLGMFSHAVASNYSDALIRNQNRIVTNGTFMLTLKEGNAYVSSYIPSGTVVAIKNNKRINFYKTKGFPPIPQYYFEIKTILGKTGYVLQNETSPVDNYQGKYIFARTEIEIYKHPDKTTVDKYKEKKVKRKIIVMSSTSPKIKEKLEVVGIDVEQDFYIVKADFLGKGIKGYVSADDIDKGLAVVTDSANLEFFDRKISGDDLDIKAILEMFLGKKVYKELSEKLSEFTQNIEFEICKCHLTVQPYAEIKADTWWICGGVKVEGAISIKAANRSYAYETYTIHSRESENVIDLIKHIECNSEDMLYPLIVKVKHNNKELILPRDNFSGLGKLLRKKSDVRAKGQYKKILTIRNYGDWLTAYTHVDNIFSDWKSAYGDTYPVLIDILIDSISYYPPSKKRVVTN